MLSRRHLRVKVLQALYAWFQSGSTSLDQGDKQLILSINKLYELFIHQLSFLTELVRYAERRMEDNKKKLLPTDDDLNPNTRFLHNRVIAAIHNNRDFRRKEARYHINWADEQELFRRFYNLMRETPEYQLYMTQPRSSFADDRKFVQFIIENLFTGFELLQSYYEEKSIYFVDDYHLVSYLLLLFVRHMKEEEFVADTPLPELLKTAHDEDNEDLEFAKQLFRKTILRSHDWDVEIARAVDNWELERIAVMDVIIIKMALTELTEFESIPVKVSLNEYIDISKYFSTSKSKVFVNGILDRLVSEFRKQDRIRKTGRGLIE
ncbi:MAG TPA: transcription antitermination factor NusB [Bacteroidales bacterium]|nr:transcription antitermination factor NusB [Bacteroidales bacterium]